jgi:hypothetical protein
MHCFSNLFLIKNSICFGQIHCPSSGVSTLYRGADKSLARPTSRCILFDGENISFDAGLVL